MDVERVVAERIGVTVGVPAYLDVPQGAPDEFLTVE